MKDFIKDEHAPRRGWMGLLARSGAAELLALELDALLVAILLVLAVLILLMRA